ncbi:MAG: hypothetical protein J6J43_03710 [Oscillospiraceae bacterium]|nr:hypothetical protein [Oscillospiraceae bacterium]
MKFELPKLGKSPTPFPHFPDRVCAFVFRALEFFTYEKIAKILGTTAENIEDLAFSMGIKEEQKSDVWIQKGYITIIRAMWHLLPYEQLLELLEMDADELAVLLREEDFLDIKLGDKPICERLAWKDMAGYDLSAVKASMESLSLEGKEPFQFEYIKPQVEFSGKEIFGTRMIYLFSGLYQKSFDVDSEEYCSDELLESYQRVGINGIYTQGVLYMLSEFPFEPSLSVGWEQRLARLKKLTERCAKYGIKVYLYLNEPRSMSRAFFEKHPDIMGHVEDEEHVCLCTSTKPVRDYISNAIESICSYAPLLGGFFCITKSENLTNCYSHVSPIHKSNVCNCPRCKHKTIGQIVGDFFAAVREGADRVSRDIKVIDFTWDMDSLETRFDIIDHLPERVVVESICEASIPYEIGGVKSTLSDYSLNIIGPGERSLAVWRRAKSRGLETSAKLQINTTWECSTVPALPVFNKVDQVMSRLVEEGVDHLQLSWTLGGYPSMNLLYSCRYFFENAKLPQMSENMKKAGESFSRAFSHFPSHMLTAYFGPQNAGPATLFYEKPTGHEATMTCFAYDDLKSWRGIYPEDVFQNQLEALCAQWKEGLRLIENDEDTQTVQMAHASYSLFRSSLNLVKFVRLRDSGGSRKALYDVVLDERENAVNMLALMNQNPAIGFEAANHYYFSRFALCEKVINCDYLLQRYKNGG